MYDEMQLSTETILAELKNAYGRWRGRETGVVSEALEKYKNHPAFSGALQLFKDYLLNDETPGKHPFRREKIALFWDASFVRTSSDFTHLIKRVDDYGAKKLSAHSLVASLSCLFQFFSIKEENPYRLVSLLLLAMLATADAAAGKLNEKDAVAEHPGAEMNFATTDHMSVWRGGGVNTEKLLKFVGERTVIYPPDSAKKAVIKNCEILKQKIVATTENLPHSRKYIIPTLRKKGFRVVCTSKEELDKATGGGADGTFVGNGLYIAVDAKKPREGLVNHEFMHAHNFFLHETKQCETDDETAFVPVYPVNAGTIREYNKAFDIGDARIKEFAGLRKKRAEGGVLTRDETELLEKYTQASAGCLISDFENEISASMYDTLIKSGWKEGARNSATVAREGGEKIEIVQITKVKKSDQSYQYMSLMRAKDSAQTVILVPSKVQTMLNLPRYRDKSESVKLAEREAYTFEELSEQAIQVFYEEAHELRQNYIKKCVGDYDKKATSHSNKG